MATAAAAGPGQFEFQQQFQQLQRPFQRSAAVVAPITNALWRLYRHRLSRLSSRAHHLARVGLNLPARLTNGLNTAASAVTWSGCNLVPPPSTRPSGEQSVRSMPSAQGQGQSSPSSLLHCIAFPSHPLLSLLHVSVPGPCLLFLLAPSSPSLRYTSRLLCWVVHTLTPYTSSYECICKFAFTTHRRLCLSV